MKLVVLRSLLKNKKEIPISKIQSRCLNNKLTNKIKNYVQRKVNEDQQDWEGAEDWNRKRHDPGYLGQ